MDRRIDFLRKLAGNERPQAAAVSYSATMRFLRKNDPDLVKDFMRSFKKSFDAALTENLEDGESVALMESFQTLGLDPKKMRG